VSERGLQIVAPRWLLACGAVALVLPDAGCDSSARGPISKAAPDGGIGQGGAGSPGSGSAAGGTAGQEEVDPATDGGTATMAPPGELPPSNPCNGYDAYCSLRYDETCFAATHASAANSAEFWQHPVQDQTLREQLNYGIRALMLSIYDDGGVATVCRGRCDEGNAPLSVVLADVATFFNENPREVVTLLIDGEFSADRLAEELRATGLDRLALPHTATDDWPTLGNMIDSGRRLVVFAPTPDTGPAWLLDRQSFIWETGKDWPSVSAMTCNPAVGDASRPLYLVHHNLVGSDDEGVGGGGGGQPSEPHSSALALATDANEFSVVRGRLEHCEAQHQRRPSFVAVDFSRVGDAQGATQVMNGVRAP
jgi:hypothetical protein